MFETEMKDLKEIYHRAMKHADDDVMEDLCYLVARMESFVEKYRAREDLQHKLDDVTNKMIQSGISSDGDDE